MITRLSKEEYYLIASAVRYLENSDFLSDGIERLRNENSEIDGLIKRHCQNDLELFLSFITANSEIYYDAEVTEEKITKVTYIRRFDHSVTESFIETEFCENPNNFDLYDESEEYRECLDCSVEKGREMVRFEALKYDLFFQPQSSKERLSSVELGDNELHIDRLADSLNVSSAIT
jgi:hypothetical protein